MVILSITFSTKLSSNTPHPLDSRGMHWAHNISNWLSPQSLFLLLSPPLPLSLTLSHPLAHENTTLIQTLFIVHQDNLHVAYQLGLIGKCLLGESGEPQLSLLSTVPYVKPPQRVRQPVVYDLRVMLL